MKNWFIYILLQSQLFGIAEQNARPENSHINKSVYGACFVFVIIVAIWLALKLKNDN